MDRQKSRRCCVDTTWFLYILEYFLIYKNIWKTTWASRCLASSKARICCFATPSPGWLITLWRDCCFKTQFYSSVSSSCKSWPCCPLSEMCVITGQSCPGGSSYTGDVILPCPQHATRRPMTSGVDEMIARRVTSCLRKATDQRVMMSRPVYGATSSFT